MHIKHKITEDSTGSIVTVVRYCTKTISFLFLMWPMQDLGLTQPLSTNELLSLGGGLERPVSKCAY